MEINIHENPEHTSLGKLSPRQVCFHYASSAYFLVLRRKAIDLAEDHVAVVDLRTGQLCKLHEDMVVREVRDVQIKGKL